MDAADDHAVARGDKNRIGHAPVVLLPNFQPDSFLAFDGQRMIRGVAIQAAALGGIFERETKRVVIRALHRNDCRAVEDHLHELGLRCVLGNEDERALARSCANSGERAGGVAGGSSDDGFLLQPIRLGHDKE